MKKILFICSRNPFSERYSGDVIKSKKFIYYLSRNYYVKIISPNIKNIKIKESRFSYEGYKKTNFFLKIFYIICSFLKLRPLQLGYFYNPKIDEYIKNNYKNFNYLFFQSFRTAQYLPKNNYKNTVLDMADIVSKNYNQTSKNLFFLNPLKFVYLIESVLLKNYEARCFKNFQKILLHSKKEINTLEKTIKPKIIQYSFGIDKIKRIYKFNKKNYKIIFVGNIKYTPNKNACFEFATKILPKINKIYPEIEFHIIGEISKIDKFLLLSKNNVKIFGKKNNLAPYLSKSICCLANLKISSGIQTKLLTYMSFGVPSISSKQVLENFDAIKQGKLAFYKNKKELIDLILKFKRNKNYSISMSQRGFKIIKKFKWDKILRILNKVFT